MWYTINKMLKEPCLTCRSDLVLPSAHWN